MNILIFAAHPDDEVLGVGGSIAKWAHEGHTVDIKILAEGVTSRDITRDASIRKDDLDQLNMCAQEVSKILGANSTELFNLPDNRMDSLDLLDVVKIIEDCIIKHDAEMIVTHHYGDLNVDHKIIHDAVLTAARPQPGSKVKRILTFETLSSTEWQSISKNNPFYPNWYENITNFLDIKIDALKAYSDEMRDFPHARSFEAVKALSQYRGSNIGVVSAEAFMMIRSIN